jgi:hypothetical protein
MGWIAGSKEHAVKQLLTGEALDAGFGRGEARRYIYHHGGKRTISSF